MDVTVVGLALLAGSAIGWMDSQPAWDDAGITVGTIVLVAGFLAPVRPRAWWAVARRLLTRQASTRRPEPAYLPV